VQEPVLTRKQALQAGISVEVIRRHVAAGRWQRVVPGVFVTFSGPIPRDAYLSALVLHAGAGAALSHHMAAELHRLVDERSAAVHVTVPVARRINRVDGMVVHRSGRVAGATHPALWPPRTRLDDTVVDLTQWTPSLKDAIGWIAAACGRQLTTAGRLRAAFAARPKVRWRRELGRVLADVEDGCHSVLEVRYCADVERAHGLPAARRQVPVGTLREDVEYEEFALVVELDGQLAHPAEGLVHDRRRDNAAVERGRRTVRYGWAEVAGDPCAVAAQVARLLAAAGWTGRPHPCRRPDCMITELPSAPTTPKPP